MEKHTGTNNEFSQILELFKKFLRAWHWFALCVIICIGLAAFYVKTTPKSYLRTAMVMIRDDRKSDFITTLDSRLLTNLNSNVKNEVEAFQSFTLIQDVVHQLNLTTNYYTQTRFKQVDLYDQTPVIALFPDASENDAFSFQVQLKPDNAVALSDFKSQGNEINLEIQGALNEVIATPVGNVILSQTDYYGSQWYIEPFFISKSRLNSETASFAKKFKATLASRDNSIIKLDITDTNIKRAEDFLKTLIEAYNNSWMTDKNILAESVSQLIEERLTLTKMELDEIDMQLAHFKSQNLLTNVQTAGTLYLNQSNFLATRIMEVRTQISIIQNISNILDRDDGITALLPLNSELTNSAIETQILQYNELLIERDRLLAGSSDRNPQIVAMNSRLQTMRQSIMQSVRNQTTNLNVVLASLREQEAQMTRQIASNPTQERQLLSIERERKTKEDMYLFLLQKREETDMLLVMESSNTRIISQPTGSEFPIKPSSKLIVLIALFLGAGIPGGVIIVKDSLDSSIRSRNDLDDLSIPLLGVIPFADKFLLRDGELIVCANGRDLHNESFRIIRANLESVCGKDLKTVMFTSLEPYSGKTFTALNLAMTLALAGKRIALLDMDMRNATLSEMISMPTKGICWYLNGVISEVKYIIEKDYFYEDFDVIPVGDIPNNPSELLMSNNLKTLIDNLKDSYDYVFMDCVTMGMVADSTIIGKFADLAVFVVREGYTNRSEINNIEKMDQNGQFQNMALILNDSKHENFQNYFSKNTRHSLKMLPRFKEPKLLLPAN